MSGMSPKVLFFEKSALALAISVFSAYFARAAENHVDSLVEEIVANVAKVKAADPGAVPMAFLFYFLCIWGLLA